MPESTASSQAGGNAKSAKATTQSAEGAGTPPAWAATISDLVISTVDSVKGKATVRVVTALRLVVYGVVILAGVLTALVLLVIGLERLWDAYLPISPLGRRVWLGYVVLGAALSAVGIWLLAASRRRQ